MSYVLPADLIEAVRVEAMEEGRGVQSGRSFNPSQVVERILREHFDAKPKRRGK